MSLRHFLEVDDLSPGELIAVLGRAADGAPGDLLTRTSIALIFEKLSLPPPSIM